MNKFLAGIQKDLKEELKKRKKDRHWRPIVRSVTYLSKSELASMAETLVNLTSFKKHMSTIESETVGGAIDVAVISKWDGFIWIKRKQYFKPEYNPHYFTRFKKY